MSQRCPVCGQTVPKGMDHLELQRRIEKISAVTSQHEVEKVRRELDWRYRKSLSKQIKEVQKRTIKQARASSRIEIESLRQQLKQAELRSHRETEKAAKEAARQSQKDIELIKERSAKERAQHVAENAKLKATIDNLSIRLEHLTSEQMGDMCEADVYATLKTAFPGDEIQRVGRGVRGADIVQRVMVAEREAGRIVYECKNVSTWDNDWLVKAKKYRTEYQTPWVIIASRTFPRRQKWFVVERGVPVIDLRLVLKLAEIVRTAVIEIGQLRTSNVGRQMKAEEMFEYILSDHFVGRFKCIAEAVAALRDQQSKEKRWHTDAWAKQTRLHDEIDDGRREIDARIRSISEISMTRNSKLVAANRRASRIELVSFRTLQSAARK